MPQQTAAYDIICGPWLFGAPKLLNACPNCARDCFFEHIPRLPAARDDMPRWFRLDEIVEGKEIFSHHLEMLEYQQLLAYMQKNRHRYIEREGSVAWT